MNKREQKSIKKNRHGLRTSDPLQHSRTPWSQSFRRPATGVSRALRARSVPESVPENGGCPRECPTGCLRGPSGPGLRSVQKVSPECPGHLFDTPGTLSGHFLDTPEPGARRVPGTPRQTLPRTPPIFGDTLGDTPGTLRARRARETPVAGWRDRSPGAESCLKFLPRFFLRGPVSGFDGPIRANHPRVPELNLFFCTSLFGSLKLTNRRFEAIRANRSNVMKIGLVLRIDSRKSILASHPDLRCESPGHLRSGGLKVVKNWTPKKQSPGQILDAFGVRGVFECCNLADILGSLRLPGCQRDLSRKSKVPPFLGITPFL